MSINDSYKRTNGKEKEEKKIEETMRIMANFLIDRFLEDKNNNYLKRAINSYSLKKDVQINNGTHI